MTTSILSLGAGIVVGVLYALSGVKSPAPPLVALLGLLGMVLGESGASLVKQRVARSARVKPETASDRSGHSPEKGLPMPSERPPSQVRYR